MNFIKALVSAECVIVLYTIAYGGGATKSIFSYYKHKVRNNENTVLIIRDSRRGGIKLLLAFLFGKKVVVNGLAAFMHWDMLLFSYFKKNAFFYLHEAEHAVEYFKKLFPVKYIIAERIFKSKALICVSEWQASYFKNKFNNSKIKIIYETVDINKQVELPRENVNIVMVGYFSKRKGVQLFSQIADLAQKENRNWKFHWVGAGPKNGLYFSPNVNWIGEMSNPLEVVKQADVFLLTSVDDPFPLACLEALSLFKRCVVYKNTGTAEIIRELNGFAVFEEYTPTDVLKAVEKALEEEVDIREVENINKNISSIESFSERLDKLLFAEKDSLKCRVKY